MEMLIPECTHPFIVFDDVVSENLMDSVKEELSYLDKFLSSNPHETGSSVSNENIPRKENSGMFLTDFYGKLGILNSPIIKSLNKIGTNEVIKTLEKYDNSFIFYKDSVIENTGGILLSKYTKGNYYLPHKDGGYYTAVLWLIFDRMEGGEFNFHFDDETNDVEVKHNRLVLFPSIYPHSVEKINSGTRYSVTKFFKR